MIVLDESFRGLVPGAVADESFRGTGLRAVPHESFGAWPQGWFYNEILGPAPRDGTTRIVRRPGSPFFVIISTGIWYQNRYHYIVQSCL